MDTDVIIVGGGLSGLALADHLQRAGVDYLLLEARPRLGGRIKTAQMADAGFDLGPSWFWPGQPRMAALVERFDLVTFEQYAKGTLRFEDERGEVQGGFAQASMAGSFRIEGGIYALIDRLASSLDAQNIQLDAAVKVLSKDKAGVTAQLQNGKTYSAKRAVLAVPPRVAAGLTYVPALPDAAAAAMRAIPTWMGGQAKFLAVYDRPFWRENGWSGDAMSRRGPMVEIHDASDPVTGCGALFGFIGVPAAARLGQDDAIKLAAVQQLGRFFGAQALTPLKVFYQDWAAQVETASDLDLASLYAHPDYALPNALSALWGKRLRMGSTEVAAQFGGYLEGALEVAEYLAQDLFADT